MDNYPSTLHASLMDQPEHRGGKCLLGGNSKQHAMFGYSCNFENLERTFSTCPKCLCKATLYLNLKKFDSQVLSSCCMCYEFSLDRLNQHGKNSSPTVPKLTIYTPGYKLTDKAGTLSVELLVNIWHYAVMQFVFNNGQKKR